METSRKRPLVQAGNLVTGISHCPPLTKTQPDIPQQGEYSGPFEKAAGGDLDPSQLFPCGFTTFLTATVLTALKKDSNKTKTSQFVNTISQLTGEVEKGA